MQTYNVSVNLKTIISKISTDKIIERVLREAITNSIHAKATKIDCFIQTQSNLLFLADSLDIKEIKEITVKDNGEGFNKENLNSFMQYGTDYKTKQWGAKGTGRFCFLKITDRVSYESLGKSIELTRDGKITQNSITPNDKETTLRLKRLNINKQEIKTDEYSLKSIPNSLKSLLLPTLILIKQKSSLVELEINFYENNKKFDTISLDSIPAIQSKTINIESINKEKYNFDLLYYINTNSREDNSFQISGYCANFIRVKNFNFKINLPKVSYIFLLKSNYLDDKADDSRTDFTIKNKEINLTNPLSWSNIDDTLKQIIQDILKHNFEDMNEKNKKSFDKAMEKFPFFQKNLDKMNAECVGYLSTKDYVKSSYDLLDNIKENLRKLQYKSLERDLTDKEFEEILDNSSLELAEYIVNRQIIINEMQDFIAENTNDEAKIHNLIMPKGEILTNNDSLINLRVCNLWLIDDKFMSFSKALSDKKIKEIKKHIIQEYSEGEGDLQEPDLFIYFDSEKSKKLVTIEIKSFVKQQKTDRKKINGLMGQLTDYADFINEAFPDIKEKWYYLITAIDDNFKRQLKKNGYKQLFSYGECYFFYNINLSTHFYVLDMQTLLDDVNARNKVFMDILTKHIK